MIAMGRYLLVIDSFKGCLTSPEAEAVVSEAILSCEPDAEVISIPVSDGGEGMLDACLSVMGGERVSLRVRDPLGESDHRCVRGHEGGGGAHRVCPCCGAPPCPARPA